MAGFIGVGSDHLGYFSFILIGFIIVFFLLRYTNRCQQRRNHRPDENHHANNDFYASRYYARTASVNHYVLDENRVARLLFAQVNSRQPAAYVLEAEMLSQSNLPRYEDALKPPYAPPTYERHVSRIPIATDYMGSLQSLHQFLFSSMPSTARIDYETSVSPAGSEANIHENKLEDTKITSWRRASHSTGDPDPIDPVLPRLARRKST